MFAVAPTMLASPLPGQKLLSVPQEAGTDIIHTFCTSVQAYNSQYSWSRPSPSHRTSP